MSQKSSTFLSGRQPGDCRPQADIIVYYSGETDAKPTVEAGVLVFNGGVANVPNRGIFNTGPGGGPFRIPYDDILPGGAGVKYRCPVADTKQRLRFTVSPAANCGEGKSSIYVLELQPLDTCARAHQYGYELPLNFFRRCSTLETDCQIVENAARLFNEEYSHLGVASSVMEGDKFALDIETLEPGETFRVLAVEGFEQPRQIVPGLKRTFTRSLVRDFFDTAPTPPTLYAGVDEDLNVAELWISQEVGTAFSGAATSDMTTDTYQYTKIRSSVLVIFDINANADAALAELKVLLKGTSNTAAKFFARTNDDTCADQLLYPTTIIRTDDGTAAAEADVKADYGNQVKAIWRAGYIGGKSYYEVVTNTADLAAPGVAQPGDSVLKGYANVPEPYTVSACPAGTPCADCKPVTVSIAP